MKENAEGRVEQFSWIHPKNTSKCHFYSQIVIQIKNKQVFLNYAIITRH